MTYLMVCLFFYVKKDNNSFIKIRSNKLKEYKEYNDKKHIMIDNMK